jgi:hypothetical protein
MSATDIRQRVIHAAKSAAEKTYRKAVFVEARAFEVSAVADREQEAARKSARLCGDHPTTLARNRAAQRATEARKLWVDCANLSAGARRELEALATWEL